MLILFALEGALEAIERGVPIARLALGPGGAMAGGVGVAGGPGVGPRADARPKLGLCPVTPHVDAGPRIEPPMSLPISIGVRPAASAAAAPPDDPPGVRSRSNGLFVQPNTSL